MTVPLDRPAAAVAPDELLVLQKWETFVGWLLHHTGKWPKAARFTLSQRIENHALDVTEMLVQARYEVRLRTRLLHEVNLRRTRARLRQRQHQLAAGAVSEQQYANSVGAVAAHLRHGNTLRLRRMLFAGDAASAAADPFLRQSREPRRQLRQRAVERAVRQPQQQRSFDPQQQPGIAPLQDVASPDRADRFTASARSAP